MRVHDQFDKIIATISDAEFAEAFGIAAEHSVGIELTTALLPGAETPFSIDTPARFLSIAKQVGCKFRFGSDAPSPADQKRLPDLTCFLQILGLSMDDLLPALSYGVLLFLALPAIRSGFFQVSLTLFVIFDVLFDGLFNAELAAMNAQRRVPVVSGLLFLSRGSRLIITILMIVMGINSPVFFAAGRMIGTIGVSDYINPVHPKILRCWTA